jgi:hypothetical protein
MIRLPAGASFAAPAGFLFLNKPGCNQTGRTLWQLCKKIAKMQNVQKSVGYYTVK